jgi:hypothetical protein
MKRCPHSHLTQIDIITKSSYRGRTVRKLCLSYMTLRFALWLTFDFGCYALLSILVGVSCPFYSCVWLFKCLGYTVDVYTFDSSYVLFMQRRSGFDHQLPTYQSTVISVYHYQLKPKTMFAVLFFFLFNIFCYLGDDMCQRFLQTILGIVID